MRQYWARVNLRHIGLSDTKSEMLFTLRRYKGIIVGITIIRREGIDVANAGFGIRHCAAVLGNIGESTN